MIASLINSSSSIMLYKSRSSIFFSKKTSYLFSSCERNPMSVIISIFDGLMIAGTFLNCFKRVLYEVEDEWNIIIWIDWLLVIGYLYFDFLCLKVFQFYLFTIFYFVFTIFYFVFTIFYFVFTLVLLRFYKKIEIIMILLKYSINI